MALVTLEEAKLHCHITGTAYDADVQQKIDAASEMLLDRLRVYVDPPWDPTTAPRMLHHLTLEIVAHLYWNRGDDRDRENTERFWKDVDRMLERSRDWLVA